MTRKEFRELKEQFEAVKNVTTEDLDFTLEKQQTKRHGLRISNNFRISHVGGDLFNLLLDEVLDEIEDIIINKVKQKGREKIAVAKDELIAGMEAELIKLKV